MGLCGTLWGVLTNFGRETSIAGLNNAAKSQSKLRMLYWEGHIFIAEGQVGEKKAFVIQSRPKISNFLYIASLSQSYRILNMLIIAVPLYYICYKADFKC